MRFLFFVVHLSTASRLRLLRYALRASKMEITCIPDLGVVMPPDDMPHATLRERAEAACKTIYELAEHGLPSETMVPQDEDSKLVEELVTSFAKDEDKTSQSLTTAAFSNLRPAVILQIDESLTEFSHAVVKNAIQIRHFVTNKLLLEASNANANVRIRALELLGKISDVGLFTERSEVTVTHRSTEDLRQSLRDKLDALRKKAHPVEEVIDAVEVEEVGEVEEWANEVPVDLISNLDEEIGFDEALAHKTITIADIFAPESK